VSDTICKNISSTDSYDIQITRVTCNILTSISRYFELLQFTIAVFPSEYVANSPYIQCMALSFVMVSRWATAAARDAALADTPRPLLGPLSSAE
jgi:hypothetical protein